MPQKLNSEDFLLTLCWAVETLMRPTLPNLLESFEGWESRHLLRFYLRNLEQKQFVTREKRAGQMVYRLTDLGRLSVQGGRDPVARWQRPWDELWRMIVFDLPRSRQGVRRRLLKWLKDNDFGYLQNSLWVRPDPIGKVVAALEEFEQDVESLTILEAHCHAHKNEAIVKGAWQFDEINRRYEAYLSLLKRKPSKASELVSWLREERFAWQHAVWADPLLPRRLLSADYAGQRAWEARQTTLKTLLDH